MLAARTSCKARASFAHYRNRVILNPLVLGQPASLQFRLLQHGSGNESVSCNSSNILKSGPKSGTSDIDSVPLEGDDETIVREAARRFRNTLPKGYLTDAQQRLYERLYGPPLRETKPEDVGIPTHAAAPVDDIADGNMGPSHVHLLARNDREHQAMLHLEREYEETRRREEAAALKQMEEEGKTKSIQEAMENDVDFFKKAENSDLHDEEDASELEGNGELDDADDVADPEMNDELKTLKSSPESLEARIKDLRKTHEVNGNPETQMTSRDWIQARIRELEKNARHTIKERKEKRPKKGHTHEEPEEIPEELLHLPENVRYHPYTMAGKFHDVPSEIPLPPQVSQSTVARLKRIDMAHLRIAANRIFGGLGLPLSPGTATKRVTLSNMNGVALHPLKRQMNELEADVFLAAYVPPAYVAAMGVLREIRKRLGSEWLQSRLKQGQKGALSILDVGGGGAALAAWDQILDAEWAVLTERGEVTGDRPIWKKTAVVSSMELQGRVKDFLPNTTFLQRLPDYEHSGPMRNEHIDAGDKPQPQKKFDIVIGSYILLQEEYGHRRQAVLNSLWNVLSNEGGILAIIEKAHNRGFEAMAHARETVLNQFLQPQLHLEETIVPEKKHFKKKHGQDKSVGQNTELDQKTEPHLNAEPDQRTELDQRTEPDQLVEPGQRMSPADQMTEDAQQAKPEQAIPDQRTEPADKKTEPEQKVDPSDQQVRPNQKTEPDPKMERDPKTELGQEVKSKQDRTPELGKEPEQESESEPELKSAQEMRPQRPFEREREPGFIIAPCTNHEICPMYKQHGRAIGRKDFCHFSHRLVRPSYYKGMVDNPNSQNRVEFSYVAFCRGVSRPKTVSPKDAVRQAFTGFEKWASPPDSLLLPRLFNLPLKKKRHVSMDVCTPEGNLERWTVPKSYSKLAYHDARKSVWGDLWALGAKTRVARKARNGKTNVKERKPEGKREKEKRIKEKKRQEKMARKACKMLGVPLDSLQTGNVMDEDKGAEVMDLAEEMLEDEEAKYSSPEERTGR